MSSFEELVRNAAIVEFFFKGKIHYLHLMMSGSEKWLISKIWVINFPFWWLISASVHQILIDSSDINQEEITLFTALSDLLNTMVY